MATWYEDDGGDEEVESDGDKSLNDDNDKEDEGGHTLDKGLFEHVNKFRLQRLEEQKGKGTITGPPSPKKDDDEGESNDDNKGGERRKKKSGRKEKEEKKRKGDDSSAIVKTPAKSRKCSETVDSPVRNTRGCSKRGK